jgi:hypothetical protein
MITVGKEPLKKPPSGVEKIMTFCFCGTLIVCSAGVCILLIVGIIKAIAAAFGAGGVY